MGTQPTSGEEILERIQNSRNINEDQEEEIPARLRKAYSTKDLMGKSPIRNAPNRIKAPSEQPKEQIAEQGSIVNKKVGTGQPNKTETGQDEKRTNKEQSQSEQLFKIQTKKAKTGWLSTEGIVEQSWAQGVGNKTPEGATTTAKTNIGTGQKQRQGGEEKERKIESGIRSLFGISPAELLRKTEKMIEEDIRKELLNRRKIANPEDQNGKSGQEGRVPIQAKGQNGSQAAQGNKKTAYEDKGKRRKEAPNPASQARKRGDNGGTAGTRKAMNSDYVRSLLGMPERSEMVKKEEEDESENPALFS